MGASNATGQGSTECGYEDGFPVPCVAVRSQQSSEENMRFQFLTQYPAVVTGSSPWN